MCVLPLEVPVLAILPVDSDIEHICKEFLY